MSSEENKMMMMIIRLVVDDDCTDKRYNLLVKNKTAIKQNEIRGAKKHKDRKLTDLNCLCD